jgi:hypothetical protein
VNVWKHCGQNAPGWWNLRDWLAAFEPFSNAGKTFYGRGWEDRTGMLYMHPEDLATYRNRGHAGLIDYVVWSYQTPIVWHDKEQGWIDPGHGYTMATKCKHYNNAAAAVSVLREEQ